MASFVCHAIIVMSIACASISATAQISAIGAVRVATDANILRGGKIIEARVGEPLAEKDTLVTGPTGAVGIVLNDNSVISLGPNSNFKLTEFTFAPRDGKLSFLGELAKGTLEYISGKISKIAKDAARFRTPFTTVAVRGTRLLVRVEE